MDDETVIRLRRVVLRLARHLNAASVGEGLTPTQASVLGIVTNRGPLGLTELTEIEGLNPTMLSRVVGKLDSFGLIRRLRDPDDFRAARVEVTPEGSRPISASPRNEPRSCPSAWRACHPRRRPPWSPRYPRWRTWPRTCGRRSAAAAASRPAGRNEASSLHLA